MTYLDKTWNQQDRTRWKNKTETFSSRLNASYQFDDNNSLGASISFLRNPKLQTDGKTEGSVLRDEVLTETNTSIRSEFGQNSNWSSNVYYVGKVGKLGIDFNTDWFWSKGNNKNNYCCPVNNSFPLYWFVYQRFIVIFTKGACLYTIRAESPIIT